MFQFGFLLETTGLTGGTGARASVGARGSMQVAVKTRRIKTCPKLWMSDTSLVVCACLGFCIEFLRAGMRY
jgi:hypothetical protein